MPKQTDVVGTIRVPEEDYGRFWNFMKTMPSSEFTPAMTASKPNGKRSKGTTSEGSTGRCLVLRALSKEALKTADINQVMVAAGKSPKSSANVIFNLKKDKLIRQANDGWYSITAAGKTFISENCNKE